MNKNPFLCIIKSECENAIGHEFDDDTWVDFCQYLEDNIRNELEERLIYSVKTHNVHALIYYMKDNNINVKVNSRTKFPTTFTPTTLKNIIHEIVHPNEVRIMECLLSYFGVILYYLIIKFGKQYVSELIE